MSRNVKHNLSIIAGVLLAVVVVCFNVLSCGALDKKESIKTEQSSEQSDAVFTTPTLSPPSVFHVNLTLDIFCLFDVKSETSVEPGQTRASIEPPKLLLTLFRVIISPNAP
jgi:hypothetical protein